MTLDIKFIDASPWQELSWLNSGGTRSKKVLQDPDGKEYFFKCSEKKAARDGKPEKYYKYEFWNEVIAYQLGTHLGLDVLRYDVAVFKDEIGCLSPKMTNTDTEQLLEVGRFMTAINPDFLPKVYSARIQYTFDLLVKTLNHFKLNKYLGIFFQTIVFDALISNTDRHQENWAFIGKNSIISTSIQLIEDETKSKGFRNLPWLLRKIYTNIIDKDNNELNSDARQMLLELTNIERMAPIYDSGSSLARELTEDRIEDLLNDSAKCEKYILEGKSELHWEGQKISHYDLIQRLLDSNHKEQIIQSSQFIDKWSNDLPIIIFQSMEGILPEKWIEYKIPLKRQELIINLLTLRLEKLKTLLSARI